MLHFLLDVVQQRLQLVGRGVAVVSAEVEQFLQGGRLSVGQELRRQFGQMKDSRQGRLAGRDVCRELLRVGGDGGDEVLRQTPASQQPRRQLGVDEAERLELHRRQVHAAAHDPIEKSGVGLAELLHQQQDADVLQQAGDEGVVAGDAPEAFAQFPGGHRLGQRVPPVPAQRAGLDPRVQPAGQAEAEHEQLQGLGAQEGQGLVQVGDDAAEAEERAIDDAEDLARQGGIVRNALLQRPGVHLGVVGQLQHFHGHGGQAVQLLGLGDKTIERGCRVDHGRNGGLSCSARFEMTPTIAG